MKKGKHHPCFFFPFLETVTLSLNCVDGMGQKCWSIYIGVKECIAVWLGVMKWNWLSGSKRSWNQRCCEQLLEQL